MELSKEQNLLCEKVREEFENLREWMLKLSKEEMLNHTYEYTAKEDMLYYFEHEILSTEICNMFLSQEAILEIIYHTYIKHDNDIYMKGIETSVKETIETL